MKTIAYLRISTPQKDAGSRCPAILEYARKHRFQIDGFFEATAWGRPAMSQREYMEIPQKVIDNLAAP
ncbi:MAG: hypothetical protein OXI01_23090 [Albidovulum sp.]|nr:hypothetical protein [Albidovulum sp.]